LSCSTTRALVQLIERRNDCLLGRDELQGRFKGWDNLLSVHQSFDAPEGGKKEFSTVIARKNQ
jgi:hypothetical protein